MFDEPWKFFTYTDCYPMMPKIYDTIWHYDKQAHKLTLTLLPLNKMAAISQMIVSDAFSWMKNFVFWLELH